MELGFNYNDGGRSKYFKKENVGDCVCRAIAIATDSDYMEIYKKINEYAKSEHITKRKRKISSARDGVYRVAYDKLLREMGWRFVPLMSIGSGCQFHLRAKEIPMNDKIICRLSKHLTCVINGVINDTYDCSREGNRCVYGYYIKDEEPKTYSEKIEDIYNKYTKDFKRKDESFALMVIKKMVEDLDKQEYDKTKYTKKDISIISEYLYDQYKKYMEERYEKLNSDEYKSKFPWRYE